MTAGELERVDRCPVCGDAARHKLFSRLEDRLFGSPGEWTLYRCDACGSGYLDPRPHGVGLDRAYARYYTHANPAPTPARGGGLARARRALKNGYLNASLGYRLRPATRSARLWLAPFPLRRRAARLAVRDLRLPGQRSRRLLDVGCGNGAFMLEARAAGWQPEGIDPDENAVRSARAAGLAVSRSTLEEAQFETGRFDAITLHHVIEHLAEPRIALDLCRKWLRPGGSLWIATPNLDAPGRRAYGEDWRGLDVPRHLVLFTPSSLESVLRSAGFDVRFLPPSPSRWILEESDSTRGDRTPLLRVRSLVRDLRGLRSPTRGEELVALATPTFDA